MKHILRILIMSFVVLFSTMAQAQDWTGIAVPANAGDGKEWALQEAPSDDFNYTFNAATQKTNFGNNKWYNFFHNAWDGPGTTYWKHDKVTVDGSNLVIKASRNLSTTKMGVPGVSSGCITSNNKVLYPVYVESSVSVANITLASDVWLLSPDDTQEIDIIECYGGKENGNAFFSKYIHLSHHSFIRQPFTDYQPRDLNSWWQKTGITSWGDYCWNNGARKYVRVGVNWVSPFHFEYYIDGELVRVLYTNAFATKVNGTWYYTYPSMTNGVLDFENGYQKITQHATGAQYSFETLQAASNVSQVSVIDPYNFQDGNGFTKEMDIIINVESQDWHVSAGRTPTDAELENPAKNTMKVDWIRVYKPVTATVKNVQAVEVTPEAITIGVEQKRTLVATLTPLNATNQAVSWSSDNAGIVTVNPTTGEITGVAVGTATITATTGDGGFTDVCTVTVQTDAVSILITGINLSPQSHQLPKGQKIQLVASITPQNADNKTLTWSSNAPTIASVDALTGLVTGVAEGQATITATANDASGKTATSSISVVNIEPTAIQFDDRNKYLNTSYIVGGEIEVSCTFNAGTGKTLDASGVTFWLRQVQADWVGITKDIKVSDVTATGKSAGTATAKISLNGVLPSDQIGTDFYFLWITLTPEGGSMYGIPAGVNPIKIITANSAVAATGVSILETTATISVGGTVSLTESVAPANASNKIVTWKSSNEAVATVDVGGVVTGLAEGIATITVKTQDGGFEATSEITVASNTVKVTAISVAPETATLAIGAEVQLTTAILPNNADNKWVIWNSSNSAVATVNAETGLVKAVAEGRTTITATANDGSGITGSSTVTVAPDAASTSISFDDESKYATAEYTVGGQLVVTCNYNAGAGKVVNSEGVKFWLRQVQEGWIGITKDYTKNDLSAAGKQSGTATATISLEGALPSSEIGTDFYFLWITLTPEGGELYNKLPGIVPIKIISANSAVAVTSISLSQTTATVGQGQAVSLNETIAPANASNKNVTWKSSDENVATVSSQGVVTGVAEGTATITVKTVDGGFEATSTITVSDNTISVSGVSLAQITATVVKGQTVSLTETIAPANASNKNVTWKSSDETIATVNNGVVSGVSAGNVTITVKTVDGGFEATSTITVTDNTVSVTGISLSQTTASMEIGQTLSLTETISPAEATNKNVSWKSGNESVATVSDGVVTAVGAGTATITATTTDGAKEASCAVTVVPAVVEVSNVLLGISSISVKMGESFTFAATVLPENATDKTISWESSNTAVATVANGVVTPESAGETTITVTSNNSKTATCLVTVVGDVVEPLGSEPISEKLSIYPVPANQFITFKGLEERDYIVTIYDLMGVERFKETMFIREQQKLDVSRLVNGIYFVELESGDTKVLLKMVVRH